MIIDKNFSVTFSIAPTRARWPRFLISKLVGQSMKLVVFASHVTLAIAMPARAWLSATSSAPVTTSTVGGPLQLGLLPFPLEEALLPGESKQVHLFEARFIQLFADAADTHCSCIGQLLFTEAGGVVPITTLLEVEEYRKEEYGVWAKLKCVGRVKLLDVEQTDYQYALATVSLFHDNLDDEAVSTAKNENLEAQVSEVHALTVDMAQRLVNAQSTAGDDESDSEERVEWGHELRDVDSEMRKPLVELIDSRRALLTSCGPDQPPLSTLSEGLADVWCSPNEEAVERTLFSFTACSTLSASERWAALAFDSVDQRLEHALEALKQRQNRFAAMLVLKGVAPSDE